MFGLTAWYLARGRVWVGVPRVLSVSRERAVDHKTVLHDFRWKASYGTQSQDNTSKPEHSAWKWFGIPWGLGIACLAALQLIRTVRRERQLSGDEEAITWQLSMFRLLPARPLSRAWGSLASSELPDWLRKPVLGLYVWLFNCQMEEAVVQELQYYQSLSQLFTRRLKPGTRTPSMHHHLVSPSDGKVLHFGKVDSDGRLEQVKGVSYKLQGFLGDTNSVLKKQHENNSNDETVDTISSMAERHLYHVVIYLAPGDYHHFHSPADWRALTRRHFPGELLTVAPWAAKTMPGLFALNERVVLLGRWSFGFFSFAAVGAYNVGSINMTVEKGLETNVKGRYKMGEFLEANLSGDTASGLAMKKGDRIGYFNLGSSVVLVFEAPSDFEFVVTPGQRVKCGDPLGTFLTPPLNSKATATHSQETLSS